MLEAIGNLWNLYDEGAWVCITTNGCVKTNGALVMGRGCAREAVNRFPELSHLFGRMVAACGNHVHTANMLRIFSFPVKHDWREDADLSLIQRSATELMSALDTLDELSYPKPKGPVYLPRPGCGNDNLDWEHVHHALADLLDDRVTVVTFA